jgi:hypothetical protein
MKADVGPDRVSLLSNSRSYSSKDAQRIQVKERMIVCVISRFFALPVPRRAAGACRLSESFNQCMRESCA